VVGGGGAEEVAGGGADEVVGVTGGEEVVGVTGAEEVVGVTAAELVVIGAAVVVVAAAAVAVAVVVVVAFLWAFFFFFFLLGSFFLCEVVVVLGVAADVEVELELLELPQPASTTAAARVVSSARFIVGLPLSLEDFGPRVQELAVDDVRPVARSVRGPPTGSRRQVLYNDRRPARLRTLGGKAAPPTNPSGRFLRRVRPRQHCERRGRGTC
jgi:hypothetical protein